MNTKKILFVVLGAGLLMSSCQKEDYTDTENTAVGKSELLNNADTVGWQKAGDWKTAEQDGFSVRYIDVEDESITSDVADNGLVLLYKKSGSSIHALPFDEATKNDEGGSSYWYHQVSEGNILIAQDVTEETAKVSPESSFRYFIITPEKLRSLEADGYNAEALINLDYAAAKALLD